MKNTSKVFGIAVITAISIAAMLLTGCPTPDENGNNNQTPVATDYDIGNLTQTAGSVTAVTITPKSGKSSGAISIKYAGSAEIPQKYRKKKVHTP